MACCFLIHYFQTQDENAIPTVLIASSPQTILPSSNVYSTPNLIVSPLFDHIKDFINPRHRRQSVKMAIVPFMPVDESTSLLFKRLSIHISISELVLISLQ